jgi:hypothetical protein
MRAVVGAVDEVEDEAGILVAGEDKEMTLSSVTRVI